MFLCAFLEGNLVSIFTGVSRGSPEESLLLIWSCLSVSYCFVIPFPAVFSSIVALGKYSIVYFAHRKRQKRSTQLFVSR